MVPIKHAKRNPDPPQLTKQLAWVLAAMPKKSPQPTSGTAALGQNTSSGSSRPPVGKKSSWHGPSEKCPENCWCKPVNQERRVSSPSRATSPLTQNSPSMAPMSLSEQGIDTLQVFPMGMELPRQREEVGKVCITDTHRQWKGSQHSAAFKCLRWPLFPPFPQLNPLPYCLTDTSLKKHHAGHQFAITFVSHLAPKLC